MNLEYIKINDKKIELVEGVNYISADNDSGKSSLVYLIKFILGGKKDIYGDKNFFDDYKKYKSKNPLLIIKWKLNNKIYTYNFKNNKLDENGRELTTAEYQKKQKKEINIFGKNVNINNQIYLSDNSVLRKNPKRIFFPQDNYSYNAFFIYHLLTNSKLEDLEMYNHFSEIAKMKKLSNSAKKVKTNLTQELSEDKIKEYSSVHKLYTELSKLNNLKNENIDEKLVNEIKGIVSNNKLIDDGIKYHKKLISDYNSIITQQRKYLEYEISKLQGDNLIDDIIYTYTTFIENSQFLDTRQKNEIKIKGEEVQKNKYYIDFFNNLEQLSEDIKNFVALEHQKLFKQKYKYDTKFILSENVEQLIFSLESEDNPGDGNRQTNYILFMLYLLNNSDKFNYFVMDTTTNNEIDGKIIELNKIIKNNLISTNKIIWFLHPNNSLNNEEYITYSYDKHNPIFIPLKK